LSFRGADRFEGGIRTAIAPPKTSEIPTSGETMSGHEPADNPHTRAIAAFVAGFRYEQLPSEVRERLKLLILDSLGCAIYGTGLPWSRILRETLASVDGTDGIGVWGTREKLSAPHAALINGTLVQSFELDDVHRIGVLHVGAVTLPPVFAVAELRPGMSGQDLLCASAVGYEIGPRVGMCMGPEHIGQGWHSGATLGVFSAAAGAAAALHLDETQAVHALGIAGTQSSGLMAAQYGAMVKRMHAGRAAQSGLYGALLAEKGFTGIVDVFESPYGGFCTTFSRSDDRFDLSELSKGLGTQFEIMRIALKFYSCVGSNHTTLDAIRSIQAERPFGAAEVGQVRVHGSKVTVDHVGWPYWPQGLTSAQLNLPYCVATFLLEGHAFVDQFTEDKVRNEGRIAMSRKVEVIEDPEITARGRVFRHMVRVEIELNDGARFERVVEAPRGSEVHFATDQDVIDKFKLLATHTMPASQADLIAELVLGLDRLDNVQPLIEALRVTAA
jgi:aconitate decarboxylase